MESEAQMSYPIDFLRQLSLQLPMQEIAILAKIKRYAAWMRLQRRIEELRKENKEEILALYSSIIKIMEKEVYDVPTTEDVLKIKKQVASINEKFRDVSKFYDSCSLQEKRKLFLPFLRQEINEFRKYEQTFVGKLELKEKWDRNDSLIYTYYKLYTELVNASYLKLRSASQDKVESTINQINSLLFVSKPVIIAYVSNRLDNKVLIKRLAELRINLRPLALPAFKPKFEKAYQELFKFPPIQGDV